MNANSKLIVVTYPAGAAGKFIQNCLGLSKHCVLKHTTWADWQCNNANDINLQESKLGQVLSTVPKNIEEWMGYELSDAKFYQDSALLEKIANQGLWTCISSHLFSYSTELSKQCSDVKHIIIEPGTDFRNTWLPIKSPNDPFLPWEIEKMPVDLGAFIFDVDNSIYNRNKFLNQISMLYTWLGFDDYNEEIVGVYYDRYIELHKKV